MDKKIDIENLLYYKYLIDLKFDIIKQKIFDENLNKKVDNFEYLINKSIDNETKEFKDIYNELHLFNKDITEYLNKIMTQGSKEDKKKYITEYENILININNFINSIRLLPVAPKISPQNKQLSPRSPPQQQQQQRQQSPNQQKKSSKLTRKLVLINAVGDGDCFINAIFDYGLYTNKLNKIYKKINYLKKNILDNKSKFQNYMEVDNLIKNLNVYEIQNADKIKIMNVTNFDAKHISKIIIKSLYLIYPTPENYLKHINIQKYYSHKVSSELLQLYKGHRSYFIYYMKFIWALYSLTIYFENFKFNLHNLYFVENISKETERELPVEIVNFIRGKYYRDGRLIDNTDFNELTIDYIMKFYEGTTIYSSDIEISIFMRMFMEPITDSEYIKDGHIIDTSFKGDKFFIDHELLTNIKKGDDYKKEYKDGIYEHNISVIHDKDHFLLCLYEDEMSYNFNDKGEIIANKLLV